jgi:hypothetical protein
VREFLGEAGIALARWSRAEIMAAARLCRALANDGPDALGARLRWILEGLRANARAVADAADKQLAGLDAALAEIAGAPAASQPDDRL